MKEDKIIELTKNLTRAFEGRDIFSKNDTIPDEFVTLEGKILELHSGLDSEGIKEAMVKVGNVFKDSWKDFVLVEPNLDIERIQNTIREYTSTRLNIDPAKDFIVTGSDRSMSRLTGGFRPGEFIVLCSPRRSGKSAFSDPVFLSRLADQMLKNRDAAVSKPALSSKEIEKSLKKERREATWKSKNKRGFQGYQGGK